MRDARSDAVQRLGFPTWADNLIVNALEDFDGRLTDCTVEGSDCTLVVRVHDGKATIAVRAYVPGIGWQTHDRVVPVR